MKKMMAFLGLTSAIALLSLVLRDFVREGIVIPVFKIIWVAGSLPQDFYWIFFLGVAVVIAARSLNKWSLPNFRTRGKQVRQPGQLEYLADLIERARHGTYTKERLARYLGELTLDILAYQERQELEVIKRHLRSGTLNVPAEIMAYLQAALLWDSSYHREERKRRLKHKEPPSPLDLEPERVMEFLERKLEGYSDA
ncbi:MAG: hypothetical protein JRI34_08055 [Deltaproteobacteria bacterium]|nr:hypothetical protein [Deltaproteobacteria bacterium]